MRSCRLLVLLAAIATSLIVTPAPARACQCLETPWIDVLMDEVPVIFRARVVEVGEVSSDDLEPIRVVLDVQAYWRDTTGAFAHQVEVWDSGPLACTSGLHRANIGQEWLVLAEVSQGRLWTSECFMTTTWSWAVYEYGNWIGPPLVVENDTSSWGMVKGLYPGE